LLSIKIAPSEIEQLQDRLFHRMWTRAELPVSTPAGPAVWLIFIDSVGVGQQVARQLTGAGHQVVTVRPGKSFSRTGRGTYVMRPGVRSDYETLLMDISKRGGLPQRFLHLWSVVDPSVHRPADETQTLGFYSLMYLAQTLGDLDMTGVDIAAVSNLLCSVSGEAIVEPARAAMFGPVRVIPKEYPGITCRSIDCDPTRDGLSYAAVQLIAELSAPFSETVVAYRGEERWVETVEQMNLSALPPKGRIQPSGAYMITGGFGELGLALAEVLNRRFQARLILVDREPIADSAERNRIAREGKVGGLEQKLSRLREIESLAADFVTVRADVTNKAEMKCALELAQSKFGRIDGVFHLQSSDASQSIQKHAEIGKHAADPKIEGSLVLAELLKATPNTFLALCSSASSFLPQAGQVDITAGDAFIDALASGASNTYSICMGLQGGLSVNDAAELLVRATSADNPSSVVVFPGNLVELTSSSREQRRSRTDEAVPKEDIEAVLTSWWKELLEQDQVGLDDDFFDLGGHSLMGVQLFSRIQSTYGVDLGLATLFEARTVRDLAKLVRESIAPVPTKTTTATVRKNSDAWSPLVPIQPKGSRPPLFVISGIGGNVVKFHTLAYYLGEDQPIYGLLPRGLDGKEQYHTRVEDIAADYVKAIREMNPNGPYHLVGYSFGGIVAFEVAQQIRAQGGNVGIVGMFDTIETHYGEKVDASLRPTERFDAMKERFDEFLTRRDRFTYISETLAAKYWSIKLSILRSLGRPLPQKVGTIEEINSYAGYNYFPKVYPGKLTLFRSTKRNVSHGDDEWCGWGELAAGGIDVHHIPATHFNILQEPAVKVVSEKLAQSLQQSQVTLEKAS
jgi:thioesterase domain-containing protein/acyl carrier protein